MSTKRQVVLAATVVLLSSMVFAIPGAYAQRSAPSSAVSHARTSAIHTHPSATTRSPRPNVAIPGSPYGYFGPNNFGPGSGIASTAGTGNFGIEAAINPATQLRIATAERLFRLHRPVGGGVGYYLLGDGGYYDGYYVPTDEGDVSNPEAQSTGRQQQPIIIVEQPSSQNATDNEQPVDEQPPPPPLPDVGQFTLVLRDGRRIETVAFTELKDKIVYITVDGNRRTINMSELDRDATKQINEERGTPVQL